MRAFRKRTNKIYMMVKGNIFMCRTPLINGVYGFGSGSSMQSAYESALKHNKYVQSINTPIKKPWYKFW